MNFLEDLINNPKFDHVYIGYTSFTRRKIMTSNCGVWLGYKKTTSDYEKELFFEMQFRYAFPKSKFGQDVWTHFKACTFLFDNIYQFTSSPPLILLSSHKAINFIHKNAFKWLSIEQAEKAKMHFWLDTLTPVFDWYNATEQPYSLLRESMREETDRVAKKVANKEFFDWTDLREPDTVKESRSETREIQP